MSETPKPDDLPPQKDVELPVMGQQASFAPLRFAVQSTSPTADGGERIQRVNYVGGQILNERDGAGNLVARFHGKNESGSDRAEIQVVSVLVEKLRADGRQVENIGKPDSDRGEDGRLLIDGVARDVQVVTLQPDQDFLTPHTADAPALRDGDANEQAGWIWAAIEKKGAKYPVDQLKVGILAIDADLLPGIASSPPVLAAFKALYGARASEIGWAEIWLVGPCARIA